MFTGNHCTFGRLPTGLSWNMFVLLHCWHQSIQVEITSDIGFSKRQTVISQSWMVSKWIFWLSNHEWFPLSFASVSFRHASSNTNTALLELLLWFDQWRWLCQIYESKFISLHCELRVLILKLFHSWRSIHTPLCKMGFEYYPAVVSSKFRIPILKTIK